MVLEISEPISDNYVGIFVPTIFFIYIDFIPYIDPTFNVAYNVQVN